MSDNFIGKRIMQPKREIMSYLGSEGIRVPHMMSLIGHFSSMHFCGIYKCIFQR